MATKSVYYDQRFLWKKGSLCSVFSRSTNTWHKAIISHIFIDNYTNKEWFTVTYNSTKKKTIQRLCKHIKPLLNTQQHNSVWIIGANKHFECGQRLRSHIISRNGNDSPIDDYGDYSNTLTLCKWSQNITNVTKIHRGYGFNLYSSRTIYDELIVFGYIQSLQSLLAKHSVYIPNHIILICLDYFGECYNEYFSVGNNESGECGIKHTDNTHELTHIDHGMNGVLKICTGAAARNVLWIQNNGSLYINGRNLQSRNDREITDILTPTQEHCFMDKSLKCIDGTSSYCHCLITCNDGSVWSLGKGNYGELGHGSNAKLFCDNFVKIKSLQRYNMIAVSTGNYFSLFLCDDGNVFSCGQNRYGQCGLEDFDEDKGRLPEKIEYFDDFDIKIAKIECGLYHSVALDKRGRVYCWGRNNLSQCAVDTSIEKAMDCPTLVTHLKKQKVVDIKTGSNHSGCVTAKNKYYIWGCNDYNECCLAKNDSDERDILFKPHLVNVYVEYVTKGKQIVDITLGSCNTMIIVCDRLA